MVEIIWKTYCNSEIIQEYRGNNTLLILSLNIGKEYNLSAVTLSEIGGLVICGNSGAVFNGVDYMKVLRKFNFEAGENRFDEGVKKLEKLLLET